MSRLLLCALACLSVAPLARATAATDGLPAVRVLFIGNSYTSVNDLPALVAQLLPARGRRLEYARVTVGGATLEKHWQEGRALEAIRGQAWDCVVLQEHSRRPFEDRAAMAKSVRLFHTEIARAGARMLLYETWAALAAPEQQDRLTATYESLVRELDATVVPVGEAWRRAQAAGLALHASDGRHPAPAGTYLSACVFVAVLSGQSASGLPAAGIAPESASLPILQLSADAAVDASQREGTGHPSRSSRR